VIRFGALRLTVQRRMKTVSGWAKLRDAAGERGRSRVGADEPMLPFRQEGERAVLDAAA
jgi:hypothetical protein